MTRRSTPLAPVIVALICFEALVFAQAFLAYRDRFFTVAQMRDRGIDQGLPFLWHFGMWGDALVISGLAAYIIGRFFYSWRLGTTLVSLAIGLLSAAIMSWIYTFSGIPEAHVQDHRLTAAGMVHLVYMAIALAVFLQFFLFTDGASVRLLRMASMLLTAHVFIGTHMLLGILTIVHPLAWYPVQPLKSVLGWITFAAVAFALICRNLTEKLRRFPFIAAWAIDYGALLSQSIDS